MRRSSLFQKANPLGGPQWFGGRHYAVLVDRSLDRAYGSYWHDGYGKWQIAVTVTYWQAVKLIRAGEGWFAGWTRFPRCCIAICQSRNEHEARQKVEEFSAVKMRAPEECGL